MEKIRKIRKTSIFLCIFICASIVLLSLFVTGCGKYKKKITWYEDRPLIVAVEVDDYAGDKMKAGVYWTEVVSYGEGIQWIYDIYILDHDLGSKYELANYQPLYTVGGGTSDSSVSGGIPLHKGEDVVIVPNKDVYYKPIGHLEMKWIRNNDE